VRLPILAGQHRGQKRATSDEDEEEEEDRVPKHPALRLSSDNGTEEDEEEDAKANGFSEDDEDDDEDYDVSSPELGRKSRAMRSNDGQNGGRQRRNPGRRARATSSSANNSSAKPSSDAASSDEDEPTARAPTTASTKTKKIPVRGRRRGGASNVGNRFSNIPEEVRFDPNSLENKPKGLVDSLSKYFTPGVKRTSRTALNSLLKPSTSPRRASDADAASKKKEASRPKRRKSCQDFAKVSSEDESARKSQSDSEGPNGDVKAAASNPAAVPTASSGRKRHTSSGQSQVRSLYDGLSHLYTDCDSRLRHIPPANYAQKRRKAGEEGVADSDGSAGRVRSPDQLARSPQPARIASPHRMSDSELKSFQENCADGKAGSVAGRRKSATGKLANGDAGDKVHERKRAHAIDISTLTCEQTKQISFLPCTSC